MSKSPNSGHSSRSQDWVGTPTNAVTRWRSISSRARSGSQRCIITSLKCQAKHDSITGMQPVTWKSGTMRMKHGGLPGLSMRGVAAHRVDGRPAAKAMSAWLIARWVETAPLGKPVVPEV